MHLQLLALGLTTTYVLYYVVIKLLLNKYTSKEILANVYLLAAIIVLIIFRNDFKSSITKFDSGYLLLIFLAVIIISSNGLGIFACNSNINFGLIDGLATAFYLPIVTLIAFYFFKSDINLINIFGILLVGIGAYFINK